MSNIVASTVAIMDSGIGGISVLKKLISKYKCGNYIYFADNLNMPYGNKNENFLTERIKEIINTLQTDYKVELIIIACNTASSVAAKLNFNNVVYLSFEKQETYLTTPLTAKLQNKPNFIADKSLAQQIENNINNNARLRRIIKHHIKINNLNKHQRLILGCTHYELVENIFKEFCAETKISNNSDNIISNITINAKDLNIVFITSKQSKEYVEKMQNLLRGI